MSFLDFDGNRTEDSLEGYLYLMRVENEARANLSAGTSPYDWKPFFSPYEFHTRPQALNVNLTDIYECSVGPIFSKSTDQIDTVFGHPLPARE